MADAAADRTERATPKKREEARKHGQVVLSTEVSPVLVLLTALAMASVGAPQLLAQSRVLLRSWLAAVGPVGAGTDAIGVAWPLLMRSASQLGQSLVPFALGLAVVGIGAVVAQVGWSVNTNLVLPDPSRVNPASGWKRIVSSNGAAMMVKSVVKIVVVLGLAYRTLRHGSEAAIAAPDMLPAEILSLTGTSLRRLLLTMAAALGVLAACDYLWVRWRYEQHLKMSRHDVKEEQKESEGDPQVKGRLRRAHRELSKRRMLTEVKRADVVVTNPIHFAVALRYRTGEVGAPTVVAKGAGALAQKITELARSAGVPIVERRALARALYRSVEIGAEIPPALYRAVAEILAYIYSLRAPAPVPEARG